MPDFDDFVQKYDICCITETHLDKFDSINIDGYTFRHISREACKRNSGGVGVFIKNTLYNKVVILENSTENFLWFKFRDNACIFGVVYSPPESSQYSSLELFDELENSILDFNVEYDDCNFCIHGNFNARGGTLPDFNMVNDYVTEHVFDDNTRNVIGFNNFEDLGFPTDHISSDVHCNNYGYRLAEMSKFTNIRFVNGRCGTDANIGKSTCNSGSVVDYVLLSDVNFPKVRHFDILEFDPLLSDVHCVLELCLNFESLNLPEAVNISSNDDEHHVIT